MICFCASVYLLNGVTILSALSRTFQEKKNNFFSDRDELHKSEVRSQKEGKRTWYSFQLIHRVLKEMIEVQDSSSIGEEIFRWELKNKLCSPTIN
jgi:hypothetical protein